MKSPYAIPRDPHWDQPLEGDVCGKSEGRFLPCLLPPGHEGPHNGWPAVLPLPKKVEKRTGEYAAALERGDVKDG